MIYNNFLKYRYLVIFLRVFIFLNPNLFSGFGGDDSYNSQIYDAAIEIIFSTIILIFLSTI